ncbi:hypothetical protein [Wolbachia endosymbiont of Oedothorax gibbosus]|nr:hypothetical protein [Wolbachia endosymbiont of Oedothorax gibbosus]
MASLGYPFRIAANKVNLKKENESLKAEDKAIKIENAELKEWQ